MARGATVHRFAIELSDVDRGVYEALDLRVARHPSENERRLVARVLAYALRHEEGIAFGRGLDEPDDPAIEVRSLRGDRTLWVDVGQPSPERLHRAMKAVGRVAVYAYQDPTAWLEALRRATVHDKDALEIVALPEPILAHLEGHLDRTTTFGLTVTDGRLYYVAGGGEAIDAPLVSLAL